MSKILVVEDDKFLANAYRVKLEKTGFEVRIAMDGEEGSVAAAEFEPDLILLDIMLPGISGFDVLEAIRKNDKWKSVPVLILSNLGQAEDIEKGKKLGVKEYIIKANAKINEVIELVRKYLA